MTRLQAIARAYLTASTVFTAVSAACADSTDRDAARCGPLALQVCASMCGRPLDPADVDSHVAINTDGCSMQDLSAAAELLGLRCLAVRWRPGELEANVPAAIIPVVNRGRRLHFVSLAGFRDGRCLIADLPYGLRWFTEDQLRGELRWTGEALHVAADEAALDALRQTVRDAAHRRNIAAWCMAGVASVAALYILHFRNRFRRSGMTRGRAMCAAPAASAANE